MSRVFHLDEPVWIDKGTEIAKLRKELAEANRARTRALSKAESAHGALLEAQEELSTVQGYLTDAVKEIDRLKASDQSSARSSTAYRTLCDLARTVLKRLPMQNDTRVQAALLGLETFMDNNPALVGAPVGTGRVRNAPMRSVQRVATSVTGRDGGRVVTEVDAAGVLTRFRVQADGTRHRLTDAHAIPEDTLDFDP